jgi:hypothetical protein
MLMDSPWCSRTAGIVMRFGWVMLAVGGIYGCAAALPRSESKVASPWSSFEQAKQAYDDIKPYSTTEDDLAALGFSPRKRPNIRILNHADLAERFVLLSLQSPESLPRGLRDCLSRCADCTGYEVDQRQIRDERYGNFLADFFNFKRKTETRGWEFRALLLLVDDVVVYKLWSGTPQIREYSDKTNPLGPLQSIGPDMVPRPGW